MGVLFLMALDISLFRIFKYEKDKYLVPSKTDISLFHIFKYQKQNTHITRAAPLRPNGQVSCLSVWNSYK